MENIIEVRQVSKSYTDFKLDQIDLDVKKGFITGFIGPNGAGKTTTIKLLMNLIKKDAGEITIFGSDNVSHDKAIKQRIGFVYDECCFFDHLSIEKNARLIAPFYQDWDQQLFNDYLKRFHLSPKKKLKNLSKGMKTKFSLATALSHHAELLIMDEPTAGLDPIFRRELLDILYELLEDEKKSIFFSTHITSDLDKIADYITFINNGKIIFSSSMNTIQESYKLVKGTKEILETMDTSLFISYQRNNFGFQGLTNKLSEVVASAPNVLIEPANLEDIMFYHARQ
ncbi:ABC transporter ATP-binding protein [Vallitalea pronyensis]|uniref:ABC transporter ATP-binding protein n=1 Tax=Vallitalea pronyensis TaxID=1348613 RepID=A0A8J8MKW2_9FIRM|nr:ABC transporter ATP-binding protein [Vallitalea pronyensis]QUI23732.1 ABC transporter ATP-binding protein [Vallitalea pronyensis]